LNALVLALGGFIIVIRQALTKYQINTHRERERESR
jgi:hypothetical protein